MNVKIDASKMLPARDPAKTGAWLPLMLGGIGALGYMLPYFMGLKARMHMTKLEKALLAVVTGIGEKYESLERDYRRLEKELGGRPTKEQLDELTQRAEAAEKRPTQEQYEQLRRRAVNAESQAEGLKLQIGKLELRQHGSGPARRRK